ncbi:hypothetical protein ABK040_016421 [Willaertia magna]
MEPQLSPSVGSENKSENLFASTFTSLIKSLLIISILIFFIYFIYFYVPEYILNWHKTPTHGGLCRGCHSIFHGSNPDYFYSNDFRSKCSCDCWDGKNKGQYSRGTFKYIYFQMEGMTLFLVSMSILIVIAFYHSFLNVLNLILENNCNYYLLFVYFIGWYGTYYSYITLYQYFNDLSHGLTLHQLYFSLTEIIMVFTVYLFLNKKRINTHYLENKYSNSLNRKLLEYLQWFVFITSLTHTIQVVRDQGLSNYGKIVFLRDVLLSLSDLPYLLMSIYYLKINWIVLSFFEKKKHNFGVIINENNNNNQSLEEGNNTSEMKYNSDWRADSAYLNNGRKKLIVSLMLILGSVIFLSNVTFGG